MSPSNYSRTATYDQTQHCYIMPGINDDPPVLYTFTTISDGEEVLADLNKEYGLNTKSYSFSYFDDIEHFRSWLRQTLAKARAIATTENIDEFLCVLDLIKEHGVEEGFFEADVVLSAGLFEEGPEDAYTRRDYTEPRLPYLVEISDLQAETSSPSSQ